MTERVALLVEQIRKLSPEERADLLDSLLIGGLQSEAVDAALINETEARLSRFLRGDTTARDAGAVLAKHIKS